SGVFLAVSRGNRQVYLDSFNVSPICLSSSGGETDDSLEGPVPSSAVTPSVGLGFDESSLATAAPGTQGATSAAPSGVIAAAAVQPIPIRPKSTTMADTTTAIPLCTICLNSALMSAPEAR